jgi:sugar porter (SP) family MFS transporter
VVALYTLFGVFGALGCTFLGDLLGRRKTIFMASIVQGIGAILQASAFGFAQFIVGRIIIGLGTGGIIATVSVWQSEVSKAESRGEHVSAFGVFCASGIALALWIAFGMSFTQPNSVSWRFTLAFTLFLSILVCASIFTLPESPRWLCKMNRWDEGREILSILYNDDPHGPVVNTEIDNIRQSFERAGSSNLSGMFKMGPQRCFHRVVLAATAQVFLQMSGVNSIAYYAPTIYSQQLHFNSTTSGILAASSQFAMILGAFCCAWTVDRFGRRRLMLVSATGMSICFACLSGVASQPNNPAALKAGVFFLYLYYFVYVLGFLGIPFLYASEIAPVHLRAATCGLSTAVSWLFNFLVAEVTPIAFTNIAWKYFLVYCCLNAAFVPTIYFFFPETAQYSLEEIDEIFESSNTIFDSVRVAKKLKSRINSESNGLEKGTNTHINETAHIEVTEAKGTASQES